LRHQLHSIQEVHTGGLGPSKERRIVIFQVATTRLSFITLCTVLLVSSSKDCLFSVENKHLTSRCWGEPSREEWMGYRHQMMEAHGYLYQERSFSRG
jgi:hypothetical protein